MSLKTFLAQILGWATGGPPSRGNTKNSPLQVNNVYIIIIVIILIINIIIIIIVIIVMIIISMIMIVMMIIITGSRLHYVCSHRCS